MRLIGVILSCLLGLAFAAAGCYVGFYLMLAGGIIDVINQIKAPEIDASIMTFGLLRALFFELPVALGIGFGMMVAGIGITLAAGQDSISYKFKYKR